MENKKPSATIPPQEDGTSIANGSNLSIRDMLSNVNDYEGVPYINADGSGNYAQEVLSQKENVRKKYEGTGQWMKAPNGEATKLTEDQWLTVRTEAFKEWFGDWENDPENASKVVDENGEPLVVYHGTDTEFDTFKLSEARDREGSFFFAEQLEDAESYAGDVPVIQYDGHKSDHRLTQLQPI